MTSRVIFCAYVAAVAALTFARYPALVHAFEPGQYAGEDPPPARFVLPTVVFGPAPRGSAATSNYRGDARRRGTSSTALGPRLGVEWCRRPLNVGVHGASKASPAVDASGVYVGTDSGFFHAFDHRGRALWSVHLPDSARGIHATAALDADTVYVGAYNGVFYALDKASGALRWTKKLGDSIGASALLHGGALFVAVETDHPDGYLVKLDARDGRLRWTSPWLGDQTHSSPTLAPDRDLVMLGANSGVFRAFAASDGRPRWSRHLLDAMKGTAVVDGARVIFSSWEKRTLALDLDTGAQLWSFAHRSPSQVSPTLAGRAGVVLVGDGAGELAALDPATGRARWTHAAGVAGYRASALATAGRGGREWLWTLCRARRLCALDPASGRVAGETELPADFSGAPVAFGPALYLALDGVDGGLCKLGVAR